MVNRFVLAARPHALLLAAILWSGCHQIDEVGAEGSTGVTILDTSDLSIIGTIPGFPGGRSLCVLDLTHFLVASNEGVMYTASLADMAVSDVRQIGSPFGSGYGGMVLATGGHVYLLGGFGRLLEYNPATHAVVDEFTAGPSPVSLCRSLAQNRIYVGDASDLEIREVSTITNEVVREVQLDGMPAALSTSSPSLNNILAATAGADHSICVLDTGSYYFWTFATPSDNAGISGLPDTSICCATQPRLDGDAGMVTLVRGADMAFPDEIQTMSLTGHPLEVCCNPPEHCFFVASYLEGGSTRIYEIDGFTWEILATADVPGYPWDIAAAGQGTRLLVLTLE